MKPRLLRPAGAWLRDFVSISHRMAKQPARDPSRHPRPDPAPAVDGSPDVREEAQLLRFVRELLRARTSEEVETLIVRGVADLLGAESAALFRRRGTGFTCVRGEGVRAPAVDVEVPLGEVQRWAERAGYAPAPVDEVSELHCFGGAVAVPLPPGSLDRHLLVLGPCPGGPSLSPEAMAALGRVADDCAAALRNAELLERLHSQVFVDFLTECYNRRGFEEHLRVETVRARRYRRPLTLMLVDIDHFKRINDAKGHPVGDHALRALGALLRRAFRTTDVICRYGGDEFAVIFPETPKEEILRLAERLRVQIRAIFPDEVLLDPISASVGVATYPQDAADAVELVHAADRALYQAKQEGRNRVMGA